jgi:hypothetical protein
MALTQVPPALLTSTTGTGSTVVLSASPTFTGTVVAPTINAGAATALTLQSAGTTAVTIDTSQNVGIGTTSPADKVSVSQDQNAQSNIAIINQNAGSSAKSAVRFSSYGGYWDIANGSIANNVNSLTFGNSGTERMRIDSSGSLAIGTSSALGKMSLYWNNTTQQGFTLQASTTTFNGSPIVFYNSSGALSGFIGQTSTTISYNTSSDYRLKENIVSMVGALKKVLLLKPVTYTWKLDGSNGQGFIAHELQEIVPDCVGGEKDAVNEDGSIKPQGIDTSFLVATLTAAIQEQQTIINDLKARIETLEAK